MKGENFIMKLIISQIVEFEEEKIPHSWRKEIETDIIPHKGDFIEDSLWKDPGEYEVVETLINYSEDYCMASVEKYCIKIPADRREEFEHMAELHGWKPLWKI